MKVLVGSRNPVKVEAVREAFAKYFDPLEVIGLEVDPQVPPQPVNEETFAGVKNRVWALQSLNAAQNLGAQFFVNFSKKFV